MQISLGTHTYKFHKKIILWKASISNRCETNLCQTLFKIPSCCYQVRRNRKRFNTCDIVKRKLVLSKFKNVPIASEVTERTFRLHEGQLPLVKHIHVVERLSFQSLVPLDDVSHVKRRVHVGGERKNVLLSRVLQNEQQ